MSGDDIYYPITWLKTLLNPIWNFFFPNAKKTKRSLAEEAECGSLEGIQSWLHDGADINALDAYGYPPILNATMLNRVDVVRALIDAGADVQRKGPFGYTALHAAAQGGYLEVVQELVRRGANVNCKNDDEDIPLILAVRGSHAEIVDYLLKAGSDIHQNGWLGQSAVHTAIANGDQATADALLRREIMGGSPTSQLNRYGNDISTVNS